MLNKNTYKGLKVYLKGYGKKSVLPVERVHHGRMTLEVNVTCPWNILFRDCISGFWKCRTVIEFSCVLTILSVISKGFLWWHCLVIVTSMSARSLRSRKQNLADCFFFLCIFVRELEVRRGANRSALTERDMRCERGKNIPWEFLSGFPDNWPWHSVIMTGLPLWAQSFVV